MKTFLNFYVLLFISLIVLSCNSQRKKYQEENFDGFSVISPQDFFKESENQLIVDVRTPKEYNEGRLESAININFFDKNFLDQFIEFKKDSPIFIYCRSGNRSGKAAKKLSKLGFKYVYDLGGGIKNWKAKEYKIVK